MSCPPTRGPRALSSIECVEFSRWAHGGASPDAKPNVSPKTELPRAAAHLGFGLTGRPPRRRSPTHSPSFNQASQCMKVVMSTHARRCKDVFATHNCAMRKHRQGEALGRGHDIRANLETDGLTGLPWSIDLSQFGGWAVEDGGARWLGEKHGDQKVDAPPPRLG